MATQQQETARETRSKTCTTPVESRGEKRETQDGSESEQATSSGKIQRVRKRHRNVHRKSPVSQSVAENVANQGVVEIAACRGRMSVCGLLGCVGVWSVSEASFCV